jgi:hypothetical protein
MSEGLPTLRLRDSVVSDIAHLTNTRVSSHKLLRELLAPTQRDVCEGK